MTSNQKVFLLNQLYTMAWNQTESFEEQRIGSSLAYLMGAILKKSICVWGENEPLVQLLKANFKPSHAVWQFVKIEP